MGVNQDFGAYDLNIAAGSGDTMVITDVYTANGKVYCRTTVITTGFVTSWVEISTPTYDSGREDPNIDDGWQEAVYEGYAARQKEWEITMAAWEELRIEMYGVFMANISFGEFQMDASSGPVFNEKFNGAFDEFFFQNDFASSLVTNPGSITITDSASFTSCMSSGPLGSSYVKKLVASFDAINALTGGYVINFKAIQGSSYAVKLWFHNPTIGWICADVNIDGLDYDEVRPAVALADVFAVYEAIGNLTVYQSAYQTTTVPYSSFDGIIDGIGVLSIYKQLFV